MLDVAPLVDFGYMSSAWRWACSGRCGLSCLRRSARTPKPCSSAAPVQARCRAPGRGPALQQRCPVRAACSCSSWAQSSGFATFTGADTGRQARIPIAPFMGIFGGALLRKGMDGPAGVVAGAD